MKKNTLGLFLSLSIFVLSVYLLVTSSPALEYPLGNNDTIPLGNFITWAGLIALPMSLYWGIGKLRRPQGSTYRTLSAGLKFLILLSLLWLPVSYGLSGNMNFNFGGTTSFQGGQTAMTLFWGLSLGIPVTSFFLLFLHLLLEAFHRLKNR